jgi:hypothetical protein
MRRRGGGNNMFPGAAPSIMDDAASGMTLLRRQREAHAPEARASAKERSEVAAAEQAPADGQSPLSTQRPRAVRTEIMVASWGRRNPAACRSRSLCSYIFLYKSL